MKKITSVIRLIFARTIQLLGNFLKIFFVIHHKLFPHQRFTIPATSKPWLKARRPKNISRIFWQTNYTDQVTLPVYVNYLWNRALTPTFEYRHALDEDCAAFIQNNFPPNITQAFQELTIGAAKADFWRCLVLLKHGGIYLDMDAGFCWPPEWFLKQDQNELFLRDRGGQITNYFIAARPDHEAIFQVTEQIRTNIEEKVTQSTYDTTGPMVFDKLLTKRSDLNIEFSSGYTKQGLFTKKVFQYPNNLSGYWVLEEQKKANKSE